MTIVSATEEFDNDRYLWLTVFRFFTAIFTNYSLEDFMKFSQFNLEVCDVIFDGSLWCTGGYIVFWFVVTLIIVLGLFIARIKFHQSASIKKCPKCKNRILCERSFDDSVPTPGPHGLGIYRRFYSVCSPGCGEKNETQVPELLCRVKTR